MKIKKGGTIRIRFSLNFFLPFSLLRVDEVMNDEITTSNEHEMKRWEQQNKCNASMTKHDTKFPTTHTHALLKQNLELYHFMTENGNFCNCLSAFEYS